MFDTGKVNDWKITLFFAKVLFKHSNIASILVPILYQSDLIFETHRFQSCSNCQSVCWNATNDRILTKELLHTSFLLQHFLHLLKFS